MSNPFRDYARIGSMGIAWVMTSLITVYLGYRGGLWLDARFETEMVFTLVGLLAGIGLSFYSLFKELLDLENVWRKEQRDAEEATKNGPDKGGS